MPPPPPTPVCIDRAERADQDAPLGSPTSTKSTNSTPIEYKKSCIARAKAARQAVASTHIVGATPRRIVEETSDELAEDDDSELPGDSLLLEPRAEQPKEGMVVSFTPDASLCMAHEALLAERTTRSLSQTLA